MREALVTLCRPGGPEQSRVCAAVPPHVVASYPRALWVYAAPVAMSARTTEAGSSNGAASSGLGQVSEGTPTAHLPPDNDGDTAVATCAPRLTLRWTWRVHDGRCILGVVHGTNTVDMTEPMGLIRPGPSEIRSIADQMDAFWDMTEASDDISSRFSRDSTPSSLKSQSDQQPVS